MVQAEPTVSMSDNLSIFTTPEAQTSSAQPENGSALTGEQATEATQHAATEDSSSAPQQSEDPPAPHTVSEPQTSEPAQPQTETEAAPLSEEEEAAMLAKAEALKQEGNTLYGQGQFDAAIDKYSDALEAAPPSASKQRAVYLANIAACDVARKQYKEAIQACDEAIREDPTYVKAYMRRSVANRELDQLDAALNDAKKVLELDATSSWATKTVKELEPVVKERHEKMKEEMLGKLKDLGNTILGKFGLSVDNFKAEKDPNTGGYSIKFQQ